METKLCEFCKKEFQPVKVWQRFCSDKCWRAQYWIDHRPKAEKKNCIICGKEFQSTRKLKKFCTLKCYQRFHCLRRHPPKERICIHCGLIFLKTGKYKYCDSCREKYRKILWQKTKNDFLYKSMHYQAALKYQTNHPEEEFARRIVTLKNKMIKKGGYKSNSKYSNMPLTILFSCSHNYPIKHHHHPDYNKPFEVALLCYKCHQKWHKKLRNQIGENP